MKEYRVTEEGKVFCNNVEKKPYVSSHGYFRINFEGKDEYVHRLVANKFLPNPYGKTDINHKNGIKLDNHINNLEWVTRAENLKHARENGLWGKNILKKRKFTDQQIIEIRNKYVPRKYSMYRLSIEYGVDYKTINYIVNQKSYQNV